jgi:F0F1-type ATP synthase membrane subunit c/vacuolar-type H+-ATPase subunit K
LPRGNKALIGIWIGFGAAIGVALNNIPIGAGMGVVIDTAMGAVKRNKRSKKYLND